jgi:predicted RND superfamily exporter protein
VLPRPGVPGPRFAAALRQFSAGAAGEPVVALARGEIVRSAAFTALAAGLALAAFMAVAWLQRFDLTLAVLLPLPMAIGLSAASVAAAKLTVTPAGLAAATVALALGLVSAAVLALNELTDTDASAARAAVLPPLVLLVGVAPLSVSALPALQDFGRMAALLLAVQLIVNLLAVPQIAAWFGRR